MAGISDDNSWVQIEFFEALNADLEAGKELPVEHYLARFPGHEELVRAAYGESSSRTNIESYGGPPRGRGNSLRRIGTYSILRILGRGGQATVYLAEDQRLGRRVALKVLDVPEDAFGEERLRRFQREAELTSRLDHPGIGVVLDIGSDLGVRFIAMRFVEGKTLAEHLQVSRVASVQGGASAVTLPESRGAGTGAPRGRTTAPGREAVARVVALIEDAARALHAAHEAGVIHRDVKPGNIMITPAGSPVILDFGLAGIEAEGGSSLTRTGDVFGTPAYMSPEQLAGVAVDRRSDVWALGVTLYESLTLRRPFEAATRQAFVDAVREASPARPSSLNRAVSRDLETIIGTALAPEAARRYQTALALAEDLRAVLDHRPIRARPMGWVARGLRWARRNPAAAALAITFALGVPALAGAAGYLAARAPEIEAGRKVRQRQEIERRLVAAYFALEFGIQTRSGGMSEAEAWFREVIEIDPENPEALDGLAFLLNRAGRGREAIALLEGRDDVPSLRRRRAQLLALAGGSDEARQNATALPPPREPREFFILANAAIERAHGGDRSAAAEALRLAEMAVSTAPEARPLYHYSLAHCAKHAEDARAIARAADSIETLWSDDPMAWFWIGFSTEFTDPDRAIAAYRKALALRGDLDAAYVNLGVILWRRRERDAASEAFRAAIAVKPGRSTPHSFLADILLDSGDVEGAIRGYKTALSHAPDHAPTLMMLGQAQCRLGRYTEAVAHLRRAVELDDRDPLAHYSLAVALHETGQAVESVAAVRRAAERDPRNGDYHLTAVRALEALGDKDGARDERRRYARAHPDEPGPWLALARSLLDDPGIEASAIAEAVSAARAAARISRYEDPVILADVAELLWRSGAEPEAVGTAHEARRVAAAMPEATAGVRERIERILRKFQRDADR